MLYYIKLLIPALARYGKTYTFLLAATILSLNAHDAYGQLVADFRMSQDKGCIPLVVQLTNTSNVTPDSCFWQLGINGNTSDNCNPSAIYNQAGTYTIKLTIFKNGQSASVSKNVTVFKDPKADFDAAPRTGCVPFTVSFQDKSTLGDAPITKWLWDMGDGRTESTQNPVHNYTFDGDLNVSLIVTDANGCKNTVTKNKFITKATPPVVDFTSDKAQSCKVPFNVQFQSTASGVNPLSYSWKFGNGDSSGAVNPMYSYTTPGTYNVTLTVKDANNCKTTVTKNAAVVMTKFKVNVTMPDEACTDQAFTPDVTSSFNNISLNWNFGNGNTSTAQQPAIVYVTPGTYAVNMKATNPEGCRDSFQQNVTVTQSPEVAFTADKLASCVPYTVNLSNQSQHATTYRWTVKNGSFTATSVAANPSFNLSANGYYDVTLVATSASGCQTTLKMPNYLYVGSDTLRVVADPVEGCAPLAVKFRAILTNHWTPTSITWNFGDGSTGTGQNVSHTYTTQGDFTARVTVTYDAPCATLTETVGPIQVGNKYPFSGTVSDDYVCVRKDTVRYHATGGVPTTEFTWIFGDGSGVGRDQSHVYQQPSDPKKFTIKLIADNNTCKDTIIVDSIFVGYPLSNFLFSGFCDDRTVSFKNTSEGYTRAVWTFSDGTTLETMQQTFTHTYAASAGNKLWATLLVYNDKTGCSDSMTKKLTLGIGDIQIDPIKDTIGCAPLKFTLSATTNVNLNSMTWMISNGATYQGNHVQGIISKEGKFTVKLIAQKGKCVDTIAYESSITVSKPDAQFTSMRTAGCMPATISFEDSSVSAFSPIVKYNWTVPGVGTANTPDATFTFNREGVFPVKLAIVNEMGCKDSLVKQLPVYKAKADFEIDRNGICAGLPITFINKSVGSNLTYFWDFGDGSTSTDTTPVHKFSAERSYTVKLVVRDAAGCADSVVKQNVVTIQNIHVDFTASPRFKSCPDLITNFQLQNPNNRYNLTKILWDFGNGNSSNDGNVAPQGVYTASDSFTVKLIVQDTKGCVDTIIKPNYVVVSGPNGSLTFSPDTGCLPVEVTFKATFENTTQAIWDFGDGTTITDRTMAASKKYTYRREGEYTPTLVLKDDFGCTVNIVSTKKISLSRLYAKLTPDKTLLCSGSGGFVLKDSVFSSFNSPVTKHVWKIYNESGDVVGTNVKNFTPPAQGHYFVEYDVQTLLGCAVKDTFSLYAYNKPVMALADDKVICKGEAIELNVNGPKQVEWSPNYAINTTNPFYVSVHPDTTTRYIVKGYDHPACPVFDTVAVDVRTRIDAKAWPDTTICMADSVLLHVLAENTSLNASKITWSPDPSLAALDINGCVCERWAVPMQKTTYRVTVSNGMCIPTVLPIVVDVRPAPTVEAGDDKMGMRGMEFLLGASSPDNVTYTWAPDYKLSCTDCPAPVATPDTDTTYEVTATNQYGCIAKDNLRIRVIEDCAGNMVYLPNTFTPNGDGINETLRVLGPGIASVKRFRVFNRWGQLVFESTDPAAGWDGTFNGTKLDPGVFVYTVEVECINGQRTMKQGDITLLR